MGLSDLEMKVLALIKKRGKMRYSEIHREIEISQGGLTKLLSRLVEKGYLVRELKKDGYPPPVYYKINLKKESEIEKLMKEETEDNFMALMEFNEEEALKLLEELKKKIEETRK